jgi:hypothetical protein
MLLYGQIISPGSETHVSRINAPCGRNVECWAAKPGGQLSKVWCRNFIEFNKSWIVKQNTFFLQLIFRLPCLLAGVHTVMTYGYWKKVPFFKLLTSGPAVICSNIEAIEASYSHSKPCKGQGHTWKSFVTIMNGKNTDGTAVSRVPPILEGKPAVSFVSYIWLNQLFWGSAPVLGHDLREQWGPSLLAREYNHVYSSVFILLMWTFGRAPNNASKREMGFNSVA